VTGVQTCALPISGERFLPGYVAFPGGSVDAEDAAVAERWFGDRSEAARAGVLRELVEECALALTAGGLEPARDAGPLDAAPPTADRLPEVAHWVAPPEVPVRFDARYFAAAPEGGGPDPVPDGTETAAAWWASPPDLLAGWEREERLLYWPTYFTMRALATCGSAAELLALRLETREPDDEELEWLHRSTFFQD